MRHCCELPAELKETPSWEVFKKKFGRYDQEWLNDNWSWLGAGEGTGPFLPFFLFFLFCMLSKDWKKEKLDLNDSVLPNVPSPLSKGIFHYISTECANSWAHFVMYIPHQGLSPWRTWPHLPLYCTVSPLPPLLGFAVPLTLTLRSISPPTPKWGNHTESSRAAAALCTRTEPRLSFPPRRIRSFKQILFNWTWRKSWAFRKWLTVRARSVRCLEMLSGALLYWIHERTD